MKCCKNDITTFCASLFEQKPICLESPGDYNWAISKKGSFSDLTSWFYLESVDRCVSSLVHGKWSTALWGEESMIIHTHTNTPAILNTLWFSTLFAWLLEYASRIKVKMLLDYINVDHKATAFRTSFSWGLLLHN